MKLVGGQKGMEDMEIERKHMILENKNLNCLVDSLKSEIKELNQSDSKMKLRVEEIMK